MANKKIKPLIFFAIIIAINLIVYYPSFFHVSRADQNIFLIEIADIDKLSDLINYSYSYLRHRIINAGDELLFRPLLYVFLSLEKWLFGYNFIYWQIMGFILHLVVLCQLMRILFLVQPSFWVFFLVLHFSVLYISLDMVIWHHINSYLLFMIFFLEAFYLFLRYIRDEEGSFKEIFLMIFYLILACFTYEFGIIGTLILAVSLFGHQKCILRRSIQEIPKERLRLIKIGPWLLLIPIICYFLINFFDYFLTAPSQRSLEAGHFKIGRISYIAFCIGIIALFGQFFPMFLKVMIDNGRTTLTTVYWKDIFSVYRADRLTDNLNLLLVIFILIAFGSFVLILSGKKFFIKSHHIKEKKEEKRVNPFLVSFLSFLMFFGYIAMLIMGRFGTREFGYIMASLYHFYILEIFLFIGLYSLCSILGHWPPAIKRYFRFLFLCIFCLSIFLNGQKSHWFNDALRRVDHKWGLLVQRMEQFVNAHKNEPDFSYYFIWQERIKIIRFRIGSVAEDNWVKGSVADFLFKKYLNIDNPKYYLVYFDKEGIVAFSSRQEATRYVNLRPEDERRQEILF